MLKGNAQDLRLTTPLVGWREWIALPDLGALRVKAKIDTGARSSSLHAFNIEEFKRGSVRWLRFQIHPLQHSARDALTAEAPLLEYRLIRSSSGHLADRPVIVTPIRIGAYQWPIELTLSTRDEMGFRMLLGRHAVKNRFLVHSGASFLISQP